jgi:hypothetical protein
MYSVDNLDEVVALDGVPLPETGAPLPMVLADDYGVVLSYLLNIAPQQDAGSVEEFAFVRFRSPLMHLFGPPNDEALEGHPLWGRGLGYYGVFRVDQSSLIRRLALMNRVHPHHDWALFEKKKHYIFTFHDSTFECVADSLEVETAKMSWDERGSRMQTLLSPNHNTPISTMEKSRPTLSTKLRWWFALLNPYRR